MTLSFTFFVLTANVLLRPVAKRFPDPVKADNNAEIEQTYRLQPIGREAESAV